MNQNDLSRTTPKCPYPREAQGPAGSRLARDTFAMILAGGRGVAAGAADRLARQARGAVRRQVPHHRLHAVELRQLRHPAHRHLHAVQGAEPDPPRAARLVVPRRPLQRVRRAAAGAAARRPPTGTRAPPTPCSRTSTSCAGTRPSTCWSSPATTSTRWTTRGCWPTTSAQRRRHDDRLHRGAARRTRRLRRDGRSTTTGASSRFEEKPAHPQPMPGRPTSRWRAWASTCSTRRSSTSS